MDGAFQFLEGLTFYGTLAALAVMAGVWYFWWHILPKIKSYDKSEKILRVIIPKIGEDIDGIIKITSSLTESLKAIKAELNKQAEIIPFHKKSLTHLLKAQQGYGREILRELSAIKGGVRTESFVYDIDYDEEIDDEPISKPVGSDTEQILDQLTLDDIRSIIRDDKNFRDYDGADRRQQHERRSGKDRRQATKAVKNDRRVIDRRSGRDRREDNTIGQLKKLSQIVDTLQDGTNKSSEHTRRRSRIRDF